MNKMRIDFDDFPEEQKSLPQVFIIEGVRDDDIQNHRVDGYILYKQLLLLGQEPRYVVVTGLNDFKAALVMFRQSNYRVLHISCHGTRDAVNLSKELIDYNTFADATRDCLKSRRIFFSACELGNIQLAELLFKVNKGMHSFVASQHPVEFKYASAFWVAFYTKYFEFQGKLTHQKMLEALSPLVQYFGVQTISAAVDTKKQRLEFFDSDSRITASISFDKLYGKKRRPKISKR